MKNFIFLILFLFPISVFAQTELSDYLTDLHSMKANFSQTIRDSRGRILDHSEGIMELLRPGKFRWETQSPQSQWVIANGNLVWIYDKDLEQATKQKQQAGRLSPAFLLSANNQHLLDDFVITKTAKSTFILKPKKIEDALFSRLILEFDQNTLSGMKMEDKLGQITVIRFSHTQRNIPLSEKEFQFTPPKGVDVVDNT